MSRLKVSYIVNGEFVELTNCPRLKQDRLLGYAVVKFANQLASRIEDCACRYHEAAPALEVSVTEKKGLLEFTHKVTACCPHFERRLSLALAS